MMRASKILVDATLQPVSETAMTVCSAMGWSAVRPWSQERTPRGALAGTLHVKLPVMRLTTGALERVPTWTVTGRLLSSVAAPTATTQTPIAFQAIQKSVTPPASTRIAIRARSGLTGTGTASPTTSVAMGLSVELIATTPGLASIPARSMAVAGVTRIATETSMKSPTRPSIETRTATTMAPRMTPSSPVACPRGMRRAAATVRTTSSPTLTRGTTTPG